MKSSENKKKEKKEKNPRQKGEVIRSMGHSVFFGIVMVVSLCLFSVVFFLVVQYSSVLEEQVKNRSLVNASDELNVLDDRLSELKMQSAVWANEIISDVTEGDSSFIAAVEEIKSNYSANSLWDVFFTTGDGNFYYDENSAVTFTASDSRKLQSAASRDEVTVAGIVHDNRLSVGKEYVAVCAPVESSSFDMLVLLFQKSVLTNLAASVDQSVLEASRFVALCTSDGGILDLWLNDDDVLSSNANVLDSLRERNVLQNDYVNRLSDFFAADETGVLFVTVNGVPYVFAVAQNADCGGFCIFSMSRSSEIYQSGYSFFSMLLTVIILLLAIVIGLAIYFIVSSVGIRRKVSDIGIVDNRLSCFTLAGFMREASSSLERYVGSDFAVVSVGVRRFDYITEVDGVEGSVELLRKIRSIFKAYTRMGECFGYDDHGEFLLLMQYKEKNLLMQRLREFYRLVYNGLSNKKYSVKLFFGVYFLLSNDASGMGRYVSNAKLAMNNGGLEKMNGNYTVYDDSMRSSYLQVSDIEIRMDYGIRNKEFRVFFQPKYNVRHDRVDGCEALVRWYDDKTNSFRQPDSFLPMLEANGFISRLDHFVFLEVCRYVSERVAAGQPVVPVSVNISRLTALDSDFLDYYINTKNNYKIPDKFITLELTESVAYENYGVLSSLMKTLRQNGFCCSIDDFGVGYSSYDLLRQLEVDEVKLDKIFIDGCLTNRRAKIILENTVSLVNKLGIKVTQEGVEDEATFAYVRSIGCDVIQGFVYSQPISEEAFSEFIRTHLNVGGEVPH